MATAEPANEVLYKSWKDVSATEFECNLQEQKDEILAVQSIYNNEYDEKLKVLSCPDEDKNNLFMLEIKVPVNCHHEEMTVQICMPWNEEENMTNNATGLKLERSLSGRQAMGNIVLKHLSPVTLNVTLPTEYPSAVMPIYTVSCMWLDASELSRVCQHLDQLWEENVGMPVLYVWLDWLENEAIKFLSIDDTVVLHPDDMSEDDMTDPRAYPECSNLEDDVLSMMRYNNIQDSRMFQRGVHECLICFDEKPGSHFYKLNECGHHFCRECVTSYCEIHVSDGTVQELICLEPDCKVILPPAVVQSVLPVEMYQRWERLMLQKSLDTMSDLVWCPRCDNAVIEDSDEDLHLAHCVTCHYSFCTLCYELWHQGEKCRLPSDKIDELMEKSRKERDAKKKDEIMKKAMHLRQEAASGVYLNKNARHCPKCDSVIEKSGGCNKMTCSQCRAAFCWRCGQDISTDGYTHFNKTKCILFTVDNPQIAYMAPRELPEAILEINLQIEIDPTARQRVMNCPSCKQRNMKANRNNHIRCWNCKANFCFVCRFRIIGKITSHFTGKPCQQHS